MNSTRTNLPIIHKLIDYRPQIPADNYLSLSSKYDQSRIYITRLELTSNMCYFPIRCLKAVVFLGSICSILISLALLALTVYLQVANKEIIYAASQSIASGLIIALYTCSIVFLLLGVAGLSGAMKRISKKQNKGTCLIALFGIGVIVFLLVFLAATIFFFVGPKTIFGTDCTEGSKTTIIGNLYSASQEAYASFCTNNCPCNIHAQDSYLAITLNTQLPNAKTNDPVGVVKFGDCPNLNNSLSNAQILSALQSLFGCGGWCPLDSGKESNYNVSFYYYRFRDVNDCTDLGCLGPIRNCHQAFQDFMTRSGRTVGYGCMAASFVCFITLMSIFCICYHPGKIDAKKSFYQRLSEMD